MRMERTVREIAGDYAVLENETGGTTEVALAGQGAEARRPGCARHVVSENAGDAFHEARRRDDSRSHLDRLLDGHQVARPLLQPVPHSGRGRAGPRPVAHPAGGPAGQGYAAVSVTEPWGGRLLRTKFLFVNPPILVYNEATKIKGEFL